jgi:membrane-bound lytic murein transglycosylase MltF
MNRAIALSCLALLLCASPVAAQQKPSPPAAPTEEKGTLPVGSRPWKGDFDEMVTKRRLIRALVPFSKTFYYVERGRARGISYDVLTQFEQDLNKKLKTKHLKVRVVFLPVGREELIQRLVDGYGDLIIADLVVTPEREKVVDFSEPMWRGVKEIVVTGLSGPQIATLDELAGKEVFVRRTSSYYEHLQGLNKRFASERKPAVKIRIADEDLEAEDILEMVNAGLVGATVVDKYKAVMWSQVFKNLKLTDAVLADGNDIAFLIRKGSPQLKAALDDFVKRHAQGTQFGNSIIHRYVKDAKFVKNALGSDEVRRFGEVVGLFRKYGDKYDVDHLLMVAQGFQESGLDQGAKSRVGAVGIMQIMPATGKELKVGDISKLEPNVHGGVKYMRFMIDQYYAKEPMTPLNKGLFAFASYNAGAGRVASLRKEAEKRGLDPNKWFHNVELVAAEKIGSETVTYVSNIYKYYTAYRLLEEQRLSRDAARDQAGIGKAAPKAAK